MRSSAGVLTASLVTAALGLAGCGGDDGKTATTPATSSTTSAAPATTGTGASGSGAVGEGYRRYAARYEAACRAQGAEQETFKAAVPRLAAIRRTDPAAAVAGFRRVAGPLFDAIDGTVTATLRDPPPELRRYVDSQRPGFARVRATLRSARAELDRATTPADLNALAPKLQNLDASGGLPSPPELDRLAPSCVALGG